MASYIIQLNEQDVMELKGIAMDRDYKEVSEFLRKKILSQVEKRIRAVWTWRESPIFEHLDILLV